MRANQGSATMRHELGFADRCRYLFERSPQPLAAVEGETHIVRYLNPAFSRLTGKKRAEMVGRPFSEVVPENGERRFMPLLDRVYRTGKPEHVIEQAQGGTPLAYWSYAVWAIAGTEGRPTGLMIQVTDTTKAAVFRDQAAVINESLMISSLRQHELTETEEKLNARLNLLLCTLPVGVMIAEDPECRAISMNPAGAHMFDLPEGETAFTSGFNVPSYRYFHEDRELTPEEMPLHRAVLDDRDISDMEIEVRLFDGQGWTGLFSATPLHDREGIVLGGIGVVLDITDRKRAEENIARLRREQEALAAHEIKNVLIPLHVYVESLLLTATGNMSTEQIGYLQKIRESTDKAFDFMQYFSRLHELELGMFRLKKDRLLLENVIRDVVDELSGRAMRSNAVSIEFTCDGAPSAMEMDARLMPGVFFNLILNAIEHVEKLNDPSKKTVQVSLRREKASLTVTINNRGEQISPMRLLTFFDKFNAGEWQNERAGLGTTYASLVTRIHGGDISVTSTVEEGTSVTVKFPVITKQYKRRRNFPVDSPPQ